MIGCRWPAHGAHSTAWLSAARTRSGQAGSVPSGRTSSAVSRPGLDRVPPPPALGGAAGLPSDRAHPDHPTRSVAGPTPTAAGATARAPRSHRRALQADTHPNRRRAPAHLEREVGGLGARVGQRREERVDAALAPADPGPARHLGPVELHYLGRPVAGALRRALGARPQLAQPAHHQVDRALVAVAAEDLGRDPVLDPLDPLERLVDRCRALARSSSSAKVDFRQSACGSRSGDGACAAGLRAVWEKVRDRPQAAGLARAAGPVARYAYRPSALRT